MQNLKFQQKFQDKQNNSIENPIGMVSISTLNKEEKKVKITIPSEQKKQEEIDLKLKKAKEISFSPFQSIIMSLIMLFFSAKNLNIISMSIISMSLMNTIKTIFSVNKVFEQLIDIGPKIIIYKIIFIAINFIQLGGVIYRINSLGLIPSFHDLITSRDLPKNSDILYGGGFNN
ncbi:er membrane protein complex subunit 4 [Anaeramoeba ignava]|uniref:ER membrane protein complex subunit 4 n=1 Tax=Anaeramoeba ignava TaxID=1746090 RepID=A0A9Q0LT33_ANAIG|nr:er membrane protein complex subunit 4 [Anaeramoeba ignava]